MCKIAIPRKCQEELWPALVRAGAAKVGCARATEELWMVGSEIPEWGVLH